MVFPVVVVLFLTALILVHAPPTHAALLDLFLDRRALVPILEFGFAPGGSLNLTISHFIVTDGPPDKFIGLYILRTDSLNVPVSGDTMDVNCPIEWDPAIYNSTIFVDLRKSGPIFDYVHQVTESESALWSAYLLNCNAWGLDFDGNGAPGGPAVSATIEYIAINPPNSLLDVGLQALPYIYLFSSIVYFLLMVLYIRILNQIDSRVFWIHRLMLVLVVCTIFDKSFHSIQNWYLNNGTDVKSWDLAAYIVTFIKSSLAMTIVALIASGWSFVRPILPKRERSVVLCIIPMQILTNLARFMMNTLAIGSASWNTWGSLFSMFDLLSFFMILWTILSTRAHLLKSVQADGKVEETLNRIKLWSALYALVLGYMYLSRIIAVLLTVTLPFTHLWVVDAYVEVVGIWFFTVIGYKFRPVAENPYMQLITINDDDDSQIKDNEEARTGTALELEHL